MSNKSLAPRRIPAWVPIRYTAFCLSLLGTGLSFAALHPAEDADFDPLSMAERPDPRRRAHLRLVH